MKIWNARSISAKLTLVIVLVSGTALLLAYISFLGYDVYTLRQNLVSSLDTEAGIISANSITALTFDDQQAAETTLSALRASPHIDAAVILLPSGDLFAQYARNGSLAPPVNRKLQATEQSGYWQKDGRLLFGRKIAFENRVLGSVYLFAQTGDVVHRARQFGVISACILVLCLLASLVATTAIRNLVTRPLTSLAKTAEAVSRDQDYSMRAQASPSGDELAMLVTSFNQMLEQIQQRDRALEDSRSELEHRVLDRTAELSAANQELEAFSYAVAHDLRGPLQQLTNLSFLMQDTCDFAGNSEGPHLLARMLEASKRMAVLIDDLLLLSRAGSAPLRRADVDLSAMVSSIGDALRIEGAARKVKFSVVAGVHVHADEGLISLVMENLLRNAWKYTSRREFAVIEFGCEETGEGPVYFVRDNGVGFDPQYSDRLFRPFQRLHSQADFPGTGVGLATVQRIVARHGGKVWANGSIDGGARFSFTLPA